MIECQKAASPACVATVPAEDRAASIKERTGDTVANSLPHYKQIGKLNDQTVQDAQAPAGAERRYAYRLGNRPNRYRATAGNGHRDCPAPYRKHQGRAGLGLPAER